MAQKVDCWKSLDGQLYDTEELADDRNARVLNEYLRDTGMDKFLESQGDVEKSEYYENEHERAKSVLSDLFQWMHAHGQIEVHVNGCITVNP